VQVFLQDWSYLGVFVGIIATGLGFPMPEELPVVIGGLLVGTHSANFWMLPVCIVGVIVGDFCLYGIGRLWGTWLVERPFIKKRLLPPERLESIRDNFQKYGIRILLFARLTPGIRAPIFLTAGIVRLPLAQFLLADGIYAIPGVSLLFFLGYFFTDTMVGWLETAQHVKSIFILLLLLGVAGYFLYRFLRRPMVVGDPQDVPHIAHSMQHTLETMTQIVHPKEKDVPASEEKKVSALGSGERVDAPSTPEAGS